MPILGNSIYSLRPIPASLLVTAPTYTQNGLEKRVCAYGCGTVETQIVPATGPALVEAVDIVYDDRTNTVHLTDVPQDKG